MFVHTKEEIINLEYVINFRWVKNECKIVFLMCGDGDYEVKFESNELCEAAWMDFMNALNKNKNFYSLGYYQ